MRGTAAQEPVCRAQGGRSCPWSAAGATSVPLEGGLGQVVTLLLVRDVTMGLSWLCKKGRRTVQAAWKVYTF